MLHWKQVSPEQGTAHCLNSDGQQLHLMKQMSLLALLGAAAEAAGLCQK